jgi:hypothetical protein
MPRGSLTALAGVEARRLLLHPLLLGGLALSLVALFAGARRDGQAQSFLLMGLGVLPLALGTFAAVNLAALRSRRAGAEELLDTLPQGVGTRTAAQLLALFAALPLAIGLLAAGYLVFGAGEGLIIGADGARRTPALVELAQGPLLILALGAFGVLLGRVAPVALLAALLVVVVLFAEVPLAAWTPDTAWRWAAPLANNMIAVPDTWHSCEPGSTSMCSTVDHFDVAGMAWHLVALAGLAVAAGAAALAGRRSVRLGLAGAALALTAVTVVGASA